MSAKIFLLNSSNPVKTRLTKQFPLNQIFVFLFYALIFLSNSDSYAYVWPQSKDKSLKIQQTPDKPNGYAVASAHPLATNIGLKILASGGNAFDAAVAVGAALAVVEPYHSGLGGGGFWLLHEAKNRKNIFIDGRETAPEAARKNMFLGLNGDPVQGLSLNGGLAAAIPGEPAALVYIAKHYGQLPLTTTLAPAIRLAEDGFIIDHQFNYFTTMEDRLEMLKRFPSSASIFLNKGKAYREGECLKQPDLAKTLRLLAEKGHEGFYRGEVAEALVKGVRANGGIWTLDDLEHYKIKVREPLTSTFRNMTLITAPLPSAGGIGLITMLNIISNYTFSSFSKVQWIHYLVESMRLTFWQRNLFLADPDYENIPLKYLLSPNNGKRLSQLIPPNKALPSESLKGFAPATAENATKKSTTHIAILDKEGNRVSATMSINFIFGSSVVAEGTGVLLNNEMDDFSTKRGAESIYGIVGSDKNDIRPGKRPLSSMTPSFLEMPNRVAIFGTPGGSRIPTMMFLSSLIFNEYSGAIRMVSSMRFHHQYLPDYLQIEPEAFSPSIQNALKDMGYKLMRLQQYYGDMQAITWDKGNKIITAASDPRHIGLAIAITDTPGGYGFDH